jgi:hypothetical protein
MSFCLKAATELADDDLDAITSTIEQAMKGGMDDKAAELLAVNDQLAVVELERRELVQLIQAQHGGKLKAKPKAKANAAPEAPKAIEDVGEKLDGARKFKTWTPSDVTDDDIANLPLSKIWPAEDVTNLEDHDQAATAFVLRGYIPAKPRTSYKVKAWVEKVKMLRGLAAKMLDGRTLDEGLAHMRDFRSGASSLNKVADKIELLSKLDRESWGRVDDVGVYPEAYRYENGEQIKTAYGSLTIDGRYKTIEGAKTVADLVGPVRALLGTAAPVKSASASFEIRQRKSGSYFINRKGDKEYRPLRDFTSVAEAREYLNGQAAELEKAWEEVKERDNVRKADVRNTENQVRAGADHRGGKDVSGEQFKDAFGFRGVQFGNWVEQGANSKGRQGMLNEAFDALMDLSKLLNIPPRAISLNGTLGLAFGARGHGWASAHFEPSNLVINLTKTRGAGTLAHEWFHALDNYFARARGGEKKFTGDNKLYRQQNYVTYMPEPGYVSKKNPGRPVTKAQLEAWRRSSPGAGYLAEDQWIQDPNHKEGIRPEVEAGFARLVEALNQSPMAARSEMNDKETDGYWGRIIERAARAFENYVIHSMGLRGFSNDYLANVRPAESFVRDPGRYPYLLPSEIEPVAKAFDDLFGTIKTREDDAGNVAMYSRGQAGQGIRPSAVQAAVDRITGKWGNAPEVEVLGSMADAPEAVRNHDAKMRSQGAQGEPEGFFYKGKVYLNASMLGDQAAVERVLFHETLGHFGLRGAFGTELDAVLRQVIGGRRAEVEAKRQAYGLPDTDAGRLVAAEEVLAELAQTKPELGLVQRAMAAIRSLLRKLGLVDGLSDAELVRNFITPARDFVERGGQAQDFTDTEPMVRQVFSRSQPLVDEDGRPVFVGDGLRLGFPQPDERFEVFLEPGQELLNYAITPDGDFDVLGHVILLVQNGRPVSLIDIEVYPGAGKGRKNGIGRKTVEAIAAMADGPLNISNIVPEARGFWAKLGIPEQNVEGAYDGQIEANRGGAGEGAGRATRAPGQGNPRTDGGNDRGTEEGLLGEGEAGDDLDGTLYSRAPSRQAFADFMEAAKDRTSTSRFNFLHKTLATQLHKAWVDKDYSKVFERAQDFERDIARAAARPAEAAPDLMPAFDNVRSAWHRFTHGNKDAERIKEVGAALWAGTLEGGPEPHTGKVWSAAQLRERFKFDDEQIKLYEQARAAIGASLDESAAALAFEMVKAYAPGLRDAVRREPGKLRELLEGERELLEAMGDDASAALYQALGVLDRADELKAGGYMPLMRFGKYAVSVTNDAGEVLHFEKHETELQAKTAALKLRREYPAAKVERSTMDTEGFKLFAGVDPESVALFAKQLEGHIQDDALQQWYRNAVSERSAMKRMIGPRKGTAGFDQDLRRVLASFITSNARLAARQLNMGDMTAAIQDMRERRVAGDVVDEAVKLKEYLENPDEPFKGLRSLMFTWYLGGSVASAAVNATQPLMMTLPYLSQFGSATKALLGATKEAMTGKVSDEKLAKAMQRAAEDGKVDPQEIHHLYHEGMSGVIDRLPGGDSLKARAQGAATLWGYMFGAVENFNRRLTFIAAYRMAEGKPELGDPYSFAIKAIDETQGIYGKSNRPNWARGTGSFGAVGVAAFTFKQYSIGYVELLVRLAKSGPKGQLAVASMLGLLFLAAGMQGLPFAEDLEDLADTVAQKLGYRGNSRAAMREILHDKMGTQLGDLVMYGASGALPLDIQGRLGMGNLAPATGIFMETNRDRKGQQIAEIFGPMGGFASQVGDAYDAKNFSSFMSSFAPIAIKNAYMGYEMAESGEYVDRRGRKVTETDDTDAFLKSIGFQPTSVASVRRPERLIAQDVMRVRQVEADIVRMRAQAMAESDPDLRREADEALREWNDKNPELRIGIKDSQVARMVKEMRRTSRDRLLDTAPRETRKALEDSLG